MVKGTGASLIKSALLLINFLLLVGGVVCIILSFLLLLDKPRLNPLLNLDDGSGTTVEILTSSAVIINIVGWITIVFSILGCCGAGRESKVLLGVYIGLTALLMVLELVGAGLAAFYRTQTETAMKTWMLEQVQTIYDGRGDSPDEFTRSMDFAQQEFECCGVENYTEYSRLALKWTERDSRIIPIGCCKVNKTAFYDANLFIPFNVTCTTSPTNDVAYIDQPCFEYIRNHLMTQALYLILIGFLLVLVEFVGIVLSCILMRTIKDTIV